MEEGYFKGLLSGISSQTGTAVLGSVDLYLGQCIRESLRGGQVNSGSSVHSVGRAKVVSHPPGRCNGATSACVPLTTPPFHSPWPSLQAAFSHAVVSGQRPDRQMDGKAKTSYLIQTIPLCYRIIISRRKKNMLLCHIKKFLQHFRKVRGNTQAACKVSRNA